MGKVHILHGETVCDGVKWILQESEHTEVVGRQVHTACVMVQNIPQHGMQLGLDSASNMGTAVTILSTLEWQYEGVEEGRFHNSPVRIGKVKMVGTLRSEIDKIAYDENVKVAVCSSSPRRIYLRDPSVEHQSCAQLNS